MPVHFGALMPLAIISAMFGATSGGLYLAQKYKNEGKYPRYNMDIWDNRMQDRDERLTGTRRGQTAEPIAPKEFGTNSYLKYEKPLNRIFM
ncbi:hypothetical protein K502DRAFT_306137 [Neoconidiobolus thromboides FSU 785]|nr:hypothetical protein K502DRAFT_306137 [Neoconidiobolus thromboides FSU 785]